MLSVRLTRYAEEMNQIAENVLAEKKHQEQFSVQGKIVMSDIQLCAQELNKKDLAWFQSKIKTLVVNYNKLKLLQKNWVKKHAIYQADAASYTRLMQELGQELEQIKFPSEADQRLIADYESINESFRVLKETGLPQLGRDENQAEEFFKMNDRLMADVARELTKKFPNIKLPPTGRERKR